MRRLLALIAIMLLFSCDKGSYDPFAPDFGKTHSGMGFYVGETKFITQTRSLWFSENVLIEWNRCILDDGVGVFIRANMIEDVSKYEENAIWIDVEGRRVCIGYHIWLYLPLEDITLGEEIVVDNPNNAISIMTNLEDDEYFWDYTSVAAPFKKLTVTYTDISKEVISGTFYAEVEPENLEQSTVIKLERGIFQLTESNRGRSYDWWLNDNCRKKDYGY